jgi:integrase
MDKPQAQKKEARFLEVHDGALLLEAARLYKYKRPDIAANCVYPLVATLLLTGGREAEVLGLEADDINFERDIITFRPNGWRRVKNEGSSRSVRLWPQLKDILLVYVFEQRATSTPLLFPSFRTKKPRMLTDIRKMLDGVGTLAGWEKGDIRSRMCRHTYCSTRLQTLANGHPIAPFDVGRELGHGGDAMVRRVYGHVGQVKHRSELVEYRIEQHEPHLRERLATLKDRSAAQADNSAATESTANEDTQQSESTAQGNPSVDDYGAAC